MKHLTSWLKRYRSFRVVVAENIGPRTDDDGWEHYAYKLDVHFQGRKMRMDWNHGIGVTDFPEDVPQDILDCMVSDAWTYTQADGYEDFCSEFGHETDDPKIRELWKGLGEFSKKVVKLLGGPGVLEDLALNYERL